MEILINISLIILIIVMAVPLYKMIRKTPKSEQIFWFSMFFLVIFVNRTIDLIF